MTSDDLLQRQLKSIPAFRAVLRAVEARFYYSIDLPRPILDVGCGDGHFSQMIFNEPVDAGIDPWWNPLQKSLHSGMYRVLAQAMGDKMPLPDNHFASAFSNSVLEHIPDIQPVLRDVSRVLRPDAPFVMTMPSQYFTEWLGGAETFERLGLSGMAGQYRRFFNGISRHAHTVAPEVWAEWLANAGFAVERWQYYFSKSALHALEVGHATGLPSAFAHALTGRWILAPWDSNLKPTEKWLRPYYEEPFGETGAYLLIIARKKADGPIPVALPEARPFSLAELEANLPRDEDEGVRGEEVGGGEAGEQGSGEAEDVRNTQYEIRQPPPKPRSTKAGDPFSIGLVILSLLAALFGQAILSGNANDPMRGVRWYAFSIFLLFAAAWRKRLFNRPDIHWRLPRLGQIRQRRWLIVLALLLSWIGFRLTAVPGSERPFLSLLLWLAAIALAWAALDNPYVIRNTQYARPAALTLGITAALFLAALLLRYVNLSDNPFMLNGIEASLGLEVVHINDGLIRNPFGAAWLSNPALLLYGMALPIRLFGRTIFAVRFLSPLIGAATVTAVWLLGKRLWGRDAALLAAILLAGGYFHLHYSRMGMTNIWDGLLILLTLGLAAIAWQRPPDAPHQRALWLAAGLALGFSAYAYTASHLLPGMLTAVLLLWLLFDRDVLRAQARHLMAALGLAFVVALPILLFYQTHPGVFTERWQALGIFAGQTGWLDAEAARTGQTQWQVFQQQLWQSVLAFNGSADKSPAFRPLVPLLSLGTAVLYIFGLALSIFRLRQFRYSLLVVWVGVTVLASALLTDTPQSHRLVIAAPALAILAGIGLAEIGRLALSGLEGDGSGKMAGGWVTAVLLTLALLFAANDAAYYFRQFPQANQYGDRNTEAADKMSRLLRELDGGWTAYLYGPPILYNDFPTFAYLLPNFPADVNFFDVAEDGVLPPASTPNMAFFYLPERVEELADTQARFDNGRVQTVNGQYGAPLFTVYLVEGN
ncbi:MAG TPA: methyltransferase domain-containing protein [Anaerolineae bacterium]|nr:methyltransferase domain-containing protein [Anaerolineae bacterium]